MKKKLNKKIFWEVFKFSLLLFILLIITPSFALAEREPAPEEKDPAPLITSINPSYGEQGMTLELTVSGKDFVDRPEISFSPPTGMTITSVKFVNPMELRVAIAIDRDAPIGLRDVTVTNPDGQFATLKGGFKILISYPLKIEEAREEAEVIIEKPFVEEKPTEKEKEAEVVEEITEEPIIPVVEQKQGFLRTISSAIYEFFVRISNFFESVIERIIGKKDQKEAPLSLSFDVLKVGRKMKEEIRAYLAMRLPEETLNELKKISEEKAVAITWKESEDPQKNLDYFTNRALADLIRATETSKTDRLSFNKAYDSFIKNLDKAISYQNEIFQAGKTLGERVEEKPEEEGCGGCGEQETVFILSGISDADISARNCRALPSPPCPPDFLCCDPPVEPEETGCECFCPKGKNLIDKDSPLFPKSSGCKPLSVKPSPPCTLEETCPTAAELMMCCDPVGFPQVGSEEWPVTCETCSYWSKCPAGKSCLEQEIECQSYRDFKRYNLSCFIECVCGSPLKQVIPAVSPRPPGCMQGVLKCNPPYMCCGLMCGVEVTDQLAGSLNVIRSRIKEIIHEYNTIWGISTGGKDFPDPLSFMLANGQYMDLQFDSIPGCPVNCNGTYTLAGRCVYSYATNNIIYGFVSRLVGLDTGTMLLGGHVANLAKDLEDLVEFKLSLELDPIEAQAAYAVGWYLAGMPMPYDAFKIRTALVSTTLDGQSALPLIAWSGYKDCNLCPIKGRAWNDFSLKAWWEGLLDFGEPDYPAPFF